MSTKLVAIQTISICLDLLNHFTNTELGLASPNYLAELFDILVNQNEFDRHCFDMYRKITNFVYENSQSATDYTTRLIEWSTRHGLLTYEQSLNYIRMNFDNYLNDSEIRSATSLLNLIPELTNGYDEVFESFRMHVISLATGSLSDFIDVTDAFAQCGYNDEEGVFKELLEILESHMDYLGVNCSSTELEDAVNSYDYMYYHQRYHERDDYSDDEETSAPSGLSIDQIDDLFDRD